MTLASNIINAVLLLIFSHDVPLISVLIATSIPLLVATTFGAFILGVMSHLCRQQSRASDLFARYGGGEFAFLLPQTNAASATNFAERIREIVNRLQVEVGENQIGISASFGVVTWVAGIDDIETVLVKVDNALYQAKRVKNTIVVVV